MLIHWFAIDGTPCRSSHSLFIAILTFEKRRRERRFGWSEAEPEG